MCNIQLNGKCTCNDLEEIYHILNYTCEYIHFWKYTHMISLTCGVENIEYIEADNRMVIHKEKMVGGTGISSSKGTSYSYIEWIYIAI